MKWLPFWSDSPKRTLLVLVLLLIGGALVNVAVAWGCARWVPFPRLPSRDSPTV